MTTQHIKDVLNETLVKYSHRNPTLRVGTQRGRKQATEMHILKTFIAVAGYTCRAVTRSNCLNIYDGKRPTTHKHTAKSN